MSSQPDITETDARTEGAPEVDGEARGREPLPEIDPDNYDVHGEIARGGMGRILHATDRRLGRDVAIKQLLVDSERRARLFEREIRISARLQHPAIVNIYEAGRLPTGELFYAMKLVAGRSLAAAIDDAETLEQRIELLPAATAVCEALAYAHQQRVIHRDLKPSNVLVGDFGETVVIDWGLARELDREDAPPTGGDAALDPAHSVSGHAVGTPAYMAPEQARGEPVDQRADVYALGAMIYHLLASRPPYRGKDAAVIIDRVKREPPPSLESVQPGLPRDLYTLVGRAMSRDPSDRYPSAVELVDDLRRFQTGKLITAHDYSRRELVARWVARNRAVVAAVSIALVILAIVLVVSVRSIIEQRDVAAERANSLTLSQARLMLERDPAGAIATLQTLPLDADDWGAVRVIAATARDRGIGVVRLRRPTELALLASAGRGDLIAAASADGAVVLVDRGQVTSLWVHDGPVTALVFDDSGRWLASASRDATVRLHDLASGTSRVLSGHELPVVQIAFSGDGAALASADSGGEVRMWKVADGSGRVWSSVEPPVVALAFAGDSAEPVVIGRAADAVLTRATVSDDGRRRAGVTGDGELRVWSEGQPARLLAGAPEQLLFAPDGELLATATGDAAALWDLSSWGRTRLPHGSAVTALAFLGDGPLIATGGRDGAIRIWRSDGALVRELRGHTAAVTTLAAAGDGATLYSGSADRTVRAWRVLPLAPLRLRGHRAGVSRVSFTGDRRLVSAGWDGTIRVWDPGSARGRVVGSHVGAVRAVAVAGELIATGGDDRAVRLMGLDGDGGRVIGNHLASVLTVAVSPDRAWVASGGRDNAVRMWSVGGETPRSFRGHTGVVNRVELSPDGRWLGSASADGTARAWNTEGDRVHVVAHGDAVHAIAFSPNSDWLASAGLDGAVRITSLESGTTRALRGHTGPVRDLAVSADGRWLASASDDMTVRVWDLERGTARVLAGHRDYVTRVGFDPRRASLLSASEDGTLSIWDVDSASRRVLEVDAWLSDLSISGDGSLIATCGATAEVLVWNNDLPAEPAALRAWLVDEVPP